jgi:hypothetical protein
MPALTRAEMHVALDLELDILNSSQMTRLDAPIKDYFLNQAIEYIIRDVIRNVNFPNEDKRVPTMSLTKGEILNKYNAIHTLIVDSPLTLISGGSNTGKIVKYTLPEAMHKFESSYSIVTPLNCASVSNIELANLLPDIGDIATFNNNPFGGGKKYMATSLIGDTLEVHNLSRYTIVSTNIVYIAKPAKLDATPTDCNLPESMHNEVVKRAATTLASITNEQYQAILNELKENKA